MVQPILTFRGLWDSVFVRTIREKTKERAQKKEKGATEMSERGRDSEAGQYWLPKRLFRVRAEIHSHFPPSSPSACTAAPQRAAYWQPRQHIVHSAERGGGTYIRERQRRGGARGEEQGCPNALTGLPPCDIKLGSNEERAWRRTGRGEGRESSTPWFLRPITTSQTAAFFKCFAKAQRRR